MIIKFNSAPGQRTMTGWLALLLTRMKRLSVGIPGRSPTPVSLARTSNCTANAPGARTVSMPMESLNYGFILPGTALDCAELVCFAFAGFASLLTQRPSSVLWCTTMSAFSITTRTILSEDWIKMSLLPLLQRR